jgi:hypothetical protein
LRGSGCLLAGRLLLLLACLAAAAARAEPAGQPGAWRSLFDGRSLGQWEVVGRYEFHGHGKVEVRDGRLVLAAGQPGTAVRWTGEVPKIDYELRLEAMRVEGDDFFCGLTFPVGKSFCSLILGGWDGSICGLSSIDGEPAAENATAFHLDVEKGKWYRVRLRVTRAKIEAWIEDRKAIDLPTEGTTLAIRFPEEAATPLSLATWRTSGAFRRLEIRTLAGTSRP